MSQEYPTQRPRKVERTSGQPITLPITALILCGGRSRRMGRTKAFLPFAGSTIIEKLIATANELFEETFLVTNEPDNYSHLGIDVLKDILPDRGPLAGILSGLLISSNPYVFVLACDMPLVDRRLLLDMSMLRHGSDVVVLKHAQGLEPLLSIYSKNCIGPLEETLFNGRLAVQDFLQGLKAKIYQYPESSLTNENLPPYFNVNTPQQYSELLTKPSIIPSRPQLSPV